MTSLLEIDHVTKAFGPNVAVDDVSLTVRAGQVHALVGENGAGKSTLMNMCFGLLRPDRGTIVMKGSPEGIANPVQARRLGIGMVHQHFKLVDSLTVVENVFLGTELKDGRRQLDTARMSASVEEVSDRFDMQLPLGARVADLSVGQRQRVEVVKALVFGARVLILDEPTAVLTPGEAGRLFGILTDLAAQDCAVLLVTHKLGEVKAVADRVTVMRRGRLVHSGAVRDVDERDIAHLMVGRHIETLLRRPRRTAAPLPIAPVRLHVQGLTVPARDGSTAVDNLHLDVHGGEIVGIAGVEGNGQAELLAAVAGVIATRSGTVTVDETDLHRLDPQHRRGAGLGYVPEDRLATGVAADMSVGDNIAAGFLDSGLTRRGVIDRKLTRELADVLVHDYDVRGAAPETSIGDLSGGNIQKVVLAREIECDPAVLLAAQPTRGVDIGAQEFIHERLRAAAGRGAGVVIVSADLAELRSLADRLFVMYRGNLVGPLDVEDGEGIGLAMAGIAHSAETADDPAHSSAPQGNASADATPPSDLRKGPKRRRELVERIVANRETRDRSHRPRRSFARLFQGAAEPVIASAVALLIGLIMVAAIGENPFIAFHWFLFGSFLTEQDFGALVIQMTPLLFTGASVLLSFRAGIFNIGAEGQLYVGALAAAVVGYAWSDLPGPLLIAVCLVSGGLAGAAWAALPAVLLARWRVEIIITSLMFNYIGMLLTSWLANGTLHDKSAGSAATHQIAAQAFLPTILGNSGATIGVFLGLATLVVLGLALTRSRWGLQVRLLGANPRFARYIGVPVSRRIVSVLLWSGVAAGLAGAITTVGVEHRFVQTFSPGYGFLGLTVALLARLRATGLVVACLGYAAIEAGAALMQLETAVPISLVNVVQGILVMIMTAQLVIRRRRPSVAADDATAPAVPEPQPSGLGRKPVFGSRATP